MRKNLIIIGAVAIVIFGILLILVAAGRPAAPAITIRHVKSVQSGDTTTLIFEVSNHTANSYVFAPSAVEVRSGTFWAPCFKFSYANGHTFPDLSPSAFMTYQCEAKNLPQGTPLRLRVTVAKMLPGLSGFARRVHLSILFHRAGVPRPFSLNPFEKNSRIFGAEIDLISEEFEESPKNEAER